MKIVCGLRLYSLEEVGRMVGVGKITLSRYVRERGVETTTIGRKKYLDEEGIRRLVSPSAVK